MHRAYLAALLLTSALPAQALAQTSATPAPAAAAAKPAVRSIADLPRFSYPISGDATRFVDRPQELAPLAARLKADVTKTLADYDIQDRATLAQLHGILRTVAIYENDSAAFARENALVRSFQDKPALQAWLGTVDSARFAAATAARPGTAAYQAAFRAELGKRLDALDWSVTGQTVKERYRGLATASEGIQRGVIAEVIQPSITKGGSVDMVRLSQLISIVNNVRTLYPLIDAEREVEGRWIAANDRPKPDVWRARNVALPASAPLTPVLIGIWDSGVDMNLFGRAAWRNPNEQANGRDDDGNGWVDDVHGVAIDVYGKRSPDLLFPLPQEFGGQLERLALVNQGLADLQSGQDTADARQAIAIYRGASAAQGKALIGGLTWYSGYGHGTHVAGIAADGNPAARLMAARMSFDWRSPPRRPTEETARAFAQSHKDVVAYWKAAGARVVNMSWGVGLKDEYEDQLIANGVPAEQAVAEGKRLFAIERQGLYDALASAPEILFVTAAGNNNDSADFSGTAPSSFDLPNVLTVAALDQAGEPTNFTTSGKTIDLAASGYQVESYMPGGRRVRWSGTSMASPQVTNAAAKLWAINPRLTVAEVREILLATAVEGPGGFKQLNTKAAVERVQAGGGAAPEQAGPSRGERG